MNKFRSHLLATAALVTLAVIGSVMSSHRADAQGGPGVTIVSPLPLPVTGTVNASQSGAWNVGLQGTPNVNVANVPSVLVGNSNTNAVWIRDVNEARQPTQGGGSMTIDSGKISESASIYSVPAGKVLVIEHFSAECSMPAAGVAMMARIFTIAGGIAKSHGLPLSPPSIAPITFTSVGSPVRLYADPSTTVGAAVFRTHEAGAAGCDVSISGHLVDL